MDIFFCANIPKAFSQPGTSRTEAPSGDAQGTLIIGSKEKQKTNVLAPDHQDVFHVLEKSDLLKIAASSIRQLSITRLRSQRLLAVSINSPDHRGFDATNSVRGIQVGVIAFRPIT